jgi:hypothetical protein
VTIKGVLLSLRDKGENMEDPRGDRAYRTLELEIGKAVHRFEEEAAPWWVDDIRVMRSTVNNKEFTVAVSVAKEGKGGEVIRMSGLEPMRGT